MRILALAVLLVGQETAVIVSVQTQDGNTVVGTVDVTSFTLETSLGKLTLQMKNVQMIRPEGKDAVVSTHDGTTLKGKISQESWKVKAALGEFTLKNADITVITVRGARLPPPRPVSPPPPNPEAGGAGAKPAPALKPAASIKIGASLTRVLRSADAKRLYVLNASDAKLLVVTLEKFGIEKEIPLAGGETFLSLAPSGNVAVAGGKRVITSVSLAQGKVVKTFPIETNVADVCALDDQTVVASTGSEIVVISVPKQAVVSKAPAGGGGRLLMSKDCRRIYANGVLVLLPDKARGRDEIAVIYTGRGLTTDAFMSPDGRFAVSTQGGVYRLGKSLVADILEVAKVEPHWTGAWAPGRKRLLVVTGAGFVKEYDTDTWELAKSWELGYQLSEAFTDDEGTVLYGVGQPAPPGAGDRPRYSHQPAPPGDLLKFDIPK